jgi:hypothetical protein
MKRRPTHNAEARRTSHGVDGSRLFGACRGPNRAGTPVEGGCGEMLPERGYRGQGPLTGGMGGVPPASLSSLSERSERIRNAPRRVHAARQRDRRRVP